MSGEWWWIAASALAWPLALLWALGLLVRLARRADRALRLESCGSEQLPTAPPLVTVIVPARNEAGNIEHCLLAVLAQDYPELEVVVVDDRSEDDTAALARQIGGGRVQVIAGEGPSPGWAGKPAACQRGAEAASGEWLLFLDADVRLAAWTVRRALAVAAERRLDLLSLWGTWELHSFWEHVLIPAIGGFVRAAHPLDRVNDPARPEAFANGQFMLFRAAAYRQMGGHGAVRSAVLEDVAFGRAVKRSGRRLGMLLAPQAFRVRLYDGFRSTWHGFSKNFYAGMDQRLGVALAAALLVGGMHLGPLLVLAAAVLFSSVGLAVAGLTGLAAQQLIRALDEREAGRSPWWGITHPLGNAVLTLLILNSALRHHLGWTVQWKGRPVAP